MIEYNGYSLQSEIAITQCYYSLTSSKEYLLRKFENSDFDEFEPKCLQTSAGGLRISITYERSFCAMRRTIRWIVDAI